jgi:hypothetical protein
MWATLVRLGPCRYTKTNTSRSLSTEIPTFSKQLLSESSGFFSLLVMIMLPRLSLLSQLSHII